MIQLPSQRNPIQCEGDYIFTGHCTLKALFAVNLDKTFTCFFLIYKTIVRNIILYLALSLGLGLRNIIFKASKDDCADYLNLVMYVVYIYHAV